MVPSLWLNEGGQSVTGKLVRPQIFLEYSCVEIVNITIIIIMAFFDNDDWIADALSPSSSFTSSLSINGELKHVTFLSHRLQQEVSCFPIKLVFTPPHLYCQLFFPQ